MTADDRARIGAIAAGLSAGETRAAVLARRLAGRPRPATSLADLIAAPDWLALPPSARRDRARRAALAGIGPELAGSIDGTWLRGFAERAGAEALDRAIATISPAARLDRFAGDDLDAVTDALLRAAVPAGLRDHVAPASGRRVDPAAAVALLATA